MNVVIWSKPDCGYCQGAKKLLQHFNVPFTEKVLGLDFTREILLEQFPTAKSFPVVVVDGFYIGGYQQLTEKLNEIKVTTQRLLNEANTSARSQRLLNEINNNVR